MSDRTLIKMNAYHYCIGFRTVSRSGKSPREFLVTRDELEKLERDQTCISQDIHCFAAFRRDIPAGTVSIEFAWLHASGAHGIEGYEETVKIPYDELMSFVRSSTEEGGPKKWAVLSITEDKTPRLVFYDVEGLRRCVNNIRVRRKLVRFLRDNFKYPRVEEIGFYHDYTPYSFFFREIRYGQEGTVGGLILHNHDNLEKAHYATHT